MYWLSLLFENESLKTAIPKSVATYVIAVQLLAVLLLSSGVQASPATNSAVSGGSGVARPILPTASNIRASTQKVHARKVCHSALPNGEGITSSLRPLVSFLSNDSH